MRVVFHIISSGGAAGASRATRYVAEREKDPAREGPGSRPLFSEDQEGLSYRHADRMLDAIEGRPEKNDLIHFSVSFEEGDFDRLGADEKEKQARLRDVVREGMKGMAEELNVERLTWIGGIHRNSDHPHAHLAMHKDAIERGTGREKRIGRIRKTLLPHKEIKDGKAVLVPGRIGEKFLAALEKQQALYLAPPDKQREKAQEVWDQLVARIRNAKADLPIESASIERTEDAYGRQPVRRGGLSANRFGDQREHSQIAASWNSALVLPEDDSRDYRIALGKRLEFGIRLTFTEVWYNRIVEHGETYRFSVVDESLNEERRISDLDVHRRAAARATRISQGDRTLRNEAIEADLDRHGETLQQLAEAREAKIDSLGKDLAGLSSKLAYVEKFLSIEPPNAEERLTPLLARHRLSELQAQAIKLNLPDEVSELEKLRIELAREHRSATRTDAEAAQLAAQLNVARADLMARDARLENFEVSVHLTTYEVHDERWSLGTLDKQVARRRDDAKLIPQRAARVDLRSLPRLNYSSAGREQASADVEHLTYIRAEIVRQIDQRREPLTEGRNRAREMVDVLQGIHRAEHQARTQEGKSRAEPKYEPYQIKTLEASAEMLRDPHLLRQVHSWEKTEGNDHSDIDWQGRAVAREIASHLAVEETKKRLDQFLESKKVASLHLGNHRTGTLREVEARTLTEYLAHALMDTREQRDHRQTVKLAAREHHGRLVNQYEKAQDYHETARELASEAKDHEPRFTDKEKINLEIYAERQNDAAERERYLGLARGESRSQEREVSVSRSR
jgi:hypothetical protein